MKKKEDNSRKSIDVAQAEILRLRALTDLEIKAIEYQEAVETYEAFDLLCTMLGGRHE